MASKIGDFSTRQVEIAALVGSGKNYDQVAAELFLAPSTVQNTLNRARQNCGANNITHLVVTMIARGALRINELGQCEPAKPVDSDDDGGEPLAA